MSFLGAVSINLSPYAGQAFAGALSDSLPCIASYDVNGQCFALWGRTPYVLSEGQSVLLDGRIFNAVALARRLGTDPLNQPMLLLHAYRRWGTDFPRYLEGEFALALWDGQNGRLLLSRDTTGYRPLFYSQQGDALRFASEVRALLTWPGTRIQADENHIARWLIVASTGANSTFFDSIFILPPGHSLLFEKGRVVLNAVWEPEKLPLLHLNDPREYADGLREVLVTAIKDRLEQLQVGSVAGSQMSGGLDSSSVAALAAGLLQQEGRRIFAFTAVPQHAVSVPHRFSDEGPHAALVAAMYPNVDHVLVRHGGHSTFSMIDRFSSAQQEPILNPSNYDWVYEICLQARRRGVDTLQTGSVGNLTISYDGVAALSSLVRQGRRFKAARLAWDLHRNGNLRWFAVAHWLLRPWMPAWARNSIDHLRTGFSGAHENSMVRREFAQSHGFGSMAYDRLCQGLDSRSLRLLCLRRIDMGPTMEAFRRLSGVSMTDPTMDRRVMEYCLSVPLEHFCEKGVPRSLIRNAMAGLLPEQVRTERRRGLQAADFAVHFRAERQEALDELVRMRRVDMAARALDLPAIEDMMHWSESRIAEYSSPIYWAKLLRALSLGRFLRRMEDGTLFSQQEDLLDRRTAETA